MSAPRAKFERIYVVSPIKVAIIFLTSLHGIFLFIAFLTSFWIETKSGHYGPLFSCEKRLIWTNYLIRSITMQCYSGGFFYDILLFRIPLTAILLILSIILSILLIITARLSFTKHSFSTRHRYWLCTIILLSIVCIIDCFILVFIPFNYQHQVYYLQWAYGVHCGGSLFIFVSLIAAILTYNTDDIRYIEGIDI
jgi:hypothetical protein